MSFERSDGAVGEWDAGVLLQAMEHALDGTFAFDRALRVRLWNPALERVLGVERVRVLGKHVFDVLPKLAHSPEATCFAQVLAGLRPQPQGSRADAWDLREPGHFERHYAPVLDAGGDVIGGLVFVRAVAPERRAPAPLTEAESALRTIADCAPVLLWMAGADASRTFFNERWLQFTGRPLEREVGAGWTEAVHHEDLQRALDSARRAFAERKPYTVEYRLRRADGEFRWIYDSAIPRRDHDGTFTGYIGSCVDITERKEAEDTLRRLTDSLARSNRELERFAWVASHDLQEPLRGVISHTQLLQRRYGAALGSDGVAIMEFVMHEAARAKRLVEDLLAYSRAERQERRFEPVDCGAMVEEVLRRLDEPIRASAAEIVCTDLPRVLGDGTLLEQVFLNLLSNSLKFRASRPLQIQIAAVANGDEWLFSVRDNGIGFSMDYADKIFIVFQRLHSQTDYPGSGIGLPISRKIVELHGGRIWAESAPDLGSTFYFTLPRAVWPEQEARRVA
jgi:PAS domain S-box-containing protein